MNGLEVLSEAAVQRWMESTQTEMDNITRELQAGVAAFGCGKATISPIAKAESTPGTVCPDPLVRM
jgi:hypothetical protein